MAAALTLGSVYIQDSQFGESLIQAAGWMEVSMDGPTGIDRAHWSGVADGIGRRALRHGPELIS
ncbi:hypothetical protein, partial [Mesorhizobium sp.]|uniref:hypothetical protein n=1 Tax=Mesorhizobium sp. TaxID=1871066 RepID=UPI0025C2415E